jgi:hypothetical protein
LQREAAPFVALRAEAHAQHHERRCAEHREKQQDRREQQPGASFCH